MPDGSRIAPLRILEHPRLRGVWRSGKAMQIAITFRKTVIYALYRRITGMARNPADAAEERMFPRMTPEEAWTDLRRSFTAYDGMQPSLSALARTFINRFEFAPAEFEKAADEDLFLADPVMWEDA
jgi:hypothetical protein